MINGSNPIFSRSLVWRSIVGLMLFVGLAGSAEADHGIVVSNISGLPNAMVIDSSGRIVTVGTRSIFGGYWAFGLSRYNSDGSLDTTFGNGGVVDTDISGSGLGADVRALAIDNLGRIIVAGTSYPLPKCLGCFLILNFDFFVARYNSDGSLDTTFGNGGIVTTDIRGDGRYDRANAVAIDSLGRIVVAGYTATVVPPDTWYPPRMALARYSSDGSLDPAFGDGGIVTTNIDGSSIRDLAIDGSGKIVAAGSTNGAFMLARYNSDGSLDHTFGNANGIDLISNIGGTDGHGYATTVAIDNLGRIVAGGSGSNYIESTYIGPLVLVRCNSDGTLDTSFGNGGTITTHISGHDGGTGDSTVADMIIDSLGRIVAVGVCPEDCGTSDFELARYNPDGSLDNTFGNGGLVTTHLGDRLGYRLSADSSQAVAMDSLGRIVVAGSAAGAFALARYNSDGSLDGAFGGALPVPPAPVVTGLRFYPSIVKKGASYSANFSGASLTDETFFDVLFTAPGSNDSAVVLNWQTGIASIHSVPADITSGTWTINGVRAHQTETDHSGNFVPVWAPITVSP